MRELLSSQAEDYLKAIYIVSQHGKVSTQAIADRLEVTPASVTGMLKKLTEMGLVMHAPYQGATLTNAGQKIALELIRHHRLLEAYLHQALGYPLEDVHDEAEKLEHVISEAFEARIFEKLGQPTHDPHGDPIPALDGTLPAVGDTPLSSLAPSTQAVIARVPDRDTEFLRYLSSLGLTPGATIKVREVAPFHGPITLEVWPEGLHRDHSSQPRSIQLGHESAARIMTSDTNHA
jgi:DtxR family Mn-dependent transcriptional regulator